MKLSSPAIRLAIVIILATCALSSSAQAQEQEARRQFLGALLALEESTQSTSQWSAWQAQGGLEELTREIDAGKLATPEKVRSSVATLTKSLGSGRTTVTRVHETMNDWLRTLEAPASGDLTSVVDTANGAIASGTADQSALNQDLRAQIERLDRSLKRTANSGARWRDFLLWDATIKLVAQEPLPHSTLDSLETRWVLAQSHWNTLRFRYLSQTVLRAIVLARRTMTSDSPEVVEQAIQSLSDFPDDMSSEATTALRALDRLDVASELSVPLHRRHAAPHCQFRIRNAAFLSRFREGIDETFPINDYFAGTPVRGTGRIRGNMSIEPQQRAVPSWSVVFRGNSTSSTVGSNSGVTVQSSASATIRGTKTIQWRNTGLVSLPANATAEASVNFGGISAGGSRGRRSAARSEVYASRAEAERDTELAIRRSCIDRLNAHTERLLRPINKHYEQTFTGPINGQTVFTPRVVVETSGDYAVWNCWYTTVDGLSLSTIPEQQDDSADWSLIFHEDFLARHLTSVLSQRDVKLHELASLLGSEPMPDASPSPVFRLRAMEPIEARFERQSVQLKLHLDEFRSPQANVTVPTTIELVYDCALKNGEVQLARAAAPLVRLQPGEAATGRTQTLKRILLRHLDRALPENTTLQIRTPRENARPNPALDAAITKFSIADGWLQASGGFSAPEKQQRKN